MNTIRSLVGVHLGTAALVLALTGSAPARPIGVWTYQDLFKFAEIAVIAQAEASTDTDDHAAELADKQNYRGVNTRFKVLATLKGQVPEKITLLHFRQKGPVAAPNGPRLVSF